MSKKSKESIPAEQPSTQKEGIELSAEEKEQINQRTAEIEQRIEAIKLIRTDEEQWNKLEDTEAQKLFDEYNAIKTEKERLQRKLEGKPENTIITAKNQEGKEIEFNLEQIKAYWIEFYRQNNLQELVKEIENTEINLTDEQIQKMKEKVREGFDKLILLPTVEIQKQNLNQIKEQTEKPIKGLKDKQQYSDEGTYLWDSVKNNLDHIQTNNRPKDKPYLLFVKDNPEVDEDTRNKTPNQLREELSQKQETGLTIEEYLIFQRDFTQRHEKEEKPHPETKYWTWLLDSELDKDSSEPGQVLSAHRSPDYRQVRVSSYPVFDSSSFIGARSSAIFEI